VVFAGLNFSINEGDILYLKGSNGSGKSTLLRLMAGLIRPINGAILWNNENIKHDQELFWGCLHYISHQDAIKMSLTVEENLKFWVDMSGFKSDRSKIHEALVTFSLNHLANLPTRYLSAGQRKRLNLARICVTPASLWLLDEPATSLDSISLSSLNGAIVAHRNTGGIVVLATHEELPSNSNILEISEFSKSRNSSLGVQS
jgi:heme exporter protein A